MDRQPIEMTVLQAATRSFEWVNSKPEYRALTMYQKKDKASALLTSMIQSGLFVITD